MVAASLGNCYYIWFAIYFSIFFITYEISVAVFRCLKNCTFVRWVDPPPLHPYQEYIYYLHNRIFNLEREVSSGNKDDEEDDNSNGASSQKVSCIDPYCNCSCHGNKGPQSPPPAMGGYYGEGATRFAI
jgi:hypothetical protein